MIRNCFLNISTAVLLLTAAASVCAEVVVIVHPSNENALDTKAVQRIFLGKEKKFSNGTAVYPINQTEGAIRSDFDSSVLGRSSTQVAAYWSKLVFTGKGIPPKEVSSDADVVAAVSADPASIGYVDSAAVTGDVKSVSFN
ncbi:phosphate ABC transporter substrate-binding protein [Aliiglaciecola sp. LCG003]|uniref:phosphate ABC transporter substrate-binding protein n=1 Tax=Aliiglaciecola sp. LCG003 TaxID=3053655 RepID=UPI00257395E8|nr:phosphate ABC transporter substrate-binding protein [Aliiglaciecola sp. LCG003]WJG08797.1 phosphate ABC transporter substrate-binding protein [Aliiglaciecola sp. LCG003]